MTNSVQLDYFEGLFLYTYFPMFDLFSISTTSSWPSLYSSEFMAYFIYLLLLGKFTYTLRLHVHVPFVNYSVHIPPLNDLHREYFEGLFCTHTSPSLTNSVQIPPLHHLVCTLGNFIAYLVFFSSWWASIYLWYFMTARNIGDLFCTHTSSWWPIP